MDRYYRFRGKMRLVGAMKELGFKAEYDLWVQGNVKRDVLIFTRKFGEAEIRIICPAGNRNCYADIVLPLGRKRLPLETSRLLEALESHGRGGWS